MGYNPGVLIDRPILEARLIRRYKRFLADVELTHGEVLTVHCPNPGALLGCTPQGARVVLRDSQNPRRKLRYTLQTIEVDGAWVNVDTSLANPLVAEAVEAGAVPELEGYERLRREVRYGRGSRIDLLLERARGTGTTGEACYVEVKSTTLVSGRTARFPDAVTLRGRKHLEELARTVAEGQRAVVFFCVARSDVASFAPADDIDPAFAETLRRGVRQGVEALAYATEVEPDRLELGPRLAVEL